MLDGVVDLSVPLYEGMPTDDLGPKFWVRISHAAARRIYRDTQSREGRVFLITDHTGTHIDGPLRFDPKGTPIEDIPLESVIRPACVFDLRAVGHGGTIGPRELERAGPDVRPGDAAIFWTAHDRRIKSPDYFWNRPRLDVDGAEWLASREVLLVAADFPGIGDPNDERFEVKRALHRHGIMTVEQLCNLAELDGKRWHLCVTPLRIRGCAGSLLRAVGLVDWQGRELVDLTLEIYSGMRALGGAVSTYWTRANHELTSLFFEGARSYQTTSLFLSEYAGTHLDAPYHSYEPGTPIDKIPLSRLFARARVVDFTHKKPLEGVTPQDLEAAVARSAGDWAAGDAIVIWTGHSKNYERPDYTTYRPFITADGATWLAERRPRFGFVVTDLIGLDDPADLENLVHLQLLSGDLPFVQVTTNLDRLAEGEWYIAAFPLKLIDGTGSPLRVFAASP